MVQRRRLGASFLKVTRSFLLNLDSEHQEAGVVFLVTISSGTELHIIDCINKKRFIFLIRYKLPPFKPNVTISYVSL